LVPWLLVWLTTIWGLRLSGHLTWRTFRGSRQAGGRHEDRRYAAMRARDERFWWTSLFKVFWLQAGILWFVSLPVQVGICPSPSLQFVALPDRLANTLIVLGSTIWAVGLFFEAIGDYQLARFVADRNNQGQVLSSGLWRYTRHPNYFGDFCVWWGLYLIALANGAWWTFVGPLAISFFLLRVSGVTLLERDIGNRRPGYREYVERTSAFFPRPPK
jgi:steroid 5-alpha reductase family enzyme